METPQNWSSLPVETRLALKFQMEKDDQKRVEVTLPKVVVPGHDCEADALPKQPREVRALLESQGRKVRTVHSRTFVKGVEYKSGKRKGELRADKETDHYGLGTVDGRFPVVYAFWMEPSFLLFSKILWTKKELVEIRLVTELKNQLEEHHGKVAG